MCIIIIKDNDNVIDDSILLKSSMINADGLGVIWLDDWEVTKHESNEYNVLQTNRPFIAHFRYATVGKICIENTHPFTINKDEVLMQNGSLHGLGSKDIVDGDEMASILADVPKKYWAKILELTDNRFLTANFKEKTYELYNSDMWIEHKGSMYSKKNVLGGDHVVAVYGTLKYGHSNFNNYLTESNHVATGETYDNYPLLIEGLPYMVEKKGMGHNVEVDLMVVDDKELAELDLLEGHPNWYERKRVPILTDDNTVVMAWLYFNNTVDIDGKDFHATYTEEYKSYEYYDRQEGFEDYSLSYNEKECCYKCNSNYVDFDEYEGANYCWDCDEFSNYRYGSLSTERLITNTIKI